MIKTKHLFAISLMSLIMICVFSGAAGVKEHENVIEEGTVQVKLVVLKANDDGTDDEFNGKIEFFNIKPSMKIKDFANKHGLKTSTVPKATNMPGLLYSYLDQTDEGTFEKDYKEHVHYYVHGGMMTLHGYKEALIMVHVMGLQNHGFRRVHKKWGCSGTWLKFEYNATMDHVAAVLGAEGHMIEAGDQDSTMVYPASEEGETVHDVWKKFGQKGFEILKLKMMF